MKTKSLSRNLPEFIRLASPFLLVCGVIVMFAVVFSSRKQSPEIAGQNAVSERSPNSDRETGETVPQQELHNLFNRNSATEIEANDSAPGLEKAGPPMANETRRPDADQVTPDGDAGDKEDEEDEDATGGPEAIRFRNLQLKDENGEIPADGLPKAKQQMDRMRDFAKKRAIAAGSPNGLEVAGLAPEDWAWLGPGNVGGRIRSIVIDPNNANNLLVGSVSGGIWRTTDTGNTWQVVDDFMANLAVSTMVRNPGNPNELYAGTGETVGGDALQGLGVFKSTDGGSTWSQLAATNPATPAVCPVAGPNCAWSYVNRLAISPDGSTILAATFSGIWRSTNGGTSWTQGAGVGGNQNVTDVDFDPTNSLNAVASGTGGFVVFSTNAGQNWNPGTFPPGPPPTPPPFGRVEIAYAPSSPNIVYASVNRNNGVNNNGELYRSVNGGANFNLVNTGNDLLGQQGEYDNIIWVNPFDPNFVIVGGVALSRSTDGGQNFTAISTNHTSSAHSDHHMIVASAGFNNSSDKSVYFANDGGMFRADDVSTVTLTNGWTHRNHRLGITQFYGGAASAIGTIFGGTQDNGTVRALTVSTINPPYDPETWDRYASGDGGYVAADPTDGNYLYSEYVNLAVQRSTNGGVGEPEYIYCNPPPPSGLSPCTGTGILDTNNGANFIAPFILDPNNSNTMLAGGLSLWRSSNIKADPLPSWTPIKAPNPTFPPPGPPFPTPPPAPNPISAIAVANGNSDFIVVGHNDGQMYLSQNGTVPVPIWTPINNASPNRFVTRIAIDITKSPYWIYATFGGFSDGNVQRTTDLGATWTDVSGNGITSLPLVPVRSIIINPAVPDSLYVGTEVGIFASGDAGATWLLPQGGPANVSVDELFWMNGDIVAATHGRGMYKTHVPVIDTNRCVSETGPSCPGTTCPSGQVACSGSGCTCCTAGDWACPCSWSNQHLPTQNDDVYVACPMTNGGVGRNITISAGAGVTFNGSGSLHAFGDLTNFGFIKVVNPFGSSAVAADGDLLNYRPGPAVTTAGVIQIPGSISAGGVLANQGIIAVSDQVTSKGFVSDSASTLTLSRMTIEGHVNHFGLVQENGAATSQSIINFKSPPSMTSTISGPGVWNAPRAQIASSNSIRLESNVTFGFGTFQNFGTFDVQNHTLTFTGATSFANQLGSSVNDLGILGMGTVAMAPSDGASTFTTEANAQVRFNPRLKIVSGVVDVSGGSIGSFEVDAGATAQVETLDVAGDININGTVAPLGGSAVLNFNGNTLTNNGAIGNLFFLNFNRSGAPRTQVMQGIGTWSPLNVQLGLYPPSLSTTTLSGANNVRFVSNSFIVSQGSTLDLSVNDITLAGPTNLVNDGSITGPFGDVRMEASGAGGRIRFSPGSIFSSDLRITTGLVSVHPGSSAILLGRDLQVDNGATFRMTGPAVSLVGNALNNGTINILPGTPFAVFEPRGPLFTNNGSISGTGLMFRFGIGFGGPFSHQLSGTGSWGPMEQLLVNSGSTLNLANNITFGGNSIYLLGTLNTGANTLSLPCSVSWGGPGDTFGIIRRTNLGLCSGPVAYGNPFTTIQFTGGTTPSEATVNVLPTLPPDFVGAIIRTYFVEALGGSGWAATLRLHYTDAELNGNDESTMSLFRSNGSIWTMQGATNRNTTDNWVEYAGVTEFSPWTLSSNVPASPSATATSTLTPTFTPTPAETTSISGTITYGNAIGNPAPPRFVKNVSLSSISGAPPVGPVVTGTPGTYALTGFGVGGYTIKPTKPGGPSGAITSNDAARVAQGVSATVPFVSMNQKFASDASGNGTVSSNDAALIARFAAGLTGTGNVGQWRFFTEDLPGPPSGPLPTPPYNDSRSYASVASSVTGEDYVALLIGEASGNWNPATHPRPANGPERSMAVELPQLTASTGKEVVIPVNVQGAANREIISYEFNLRYDSTVIQPLKFPVDVSGTASRGLIAVANPFEPGLLRIVVYGPMPIDGDGVLLNLRFAGVGTSGSVSPLSFERIVFNEGEPKVRALDGNIELF